MAISAARRKGLFRIEAVNPLESKPNLYPNPYVVKVSSWLKPEAETSRKQHRRAKQLHADLVTLGYTGS